MSDEVGDEQTFENLSNNQSERNWVISERVGAVTFLRNRLKKCMLSIRMLMQELRQAKTDNKGQANS